MKAHRQLTSLLLAVLLSAAPGFGAPVIRHEPARVAEKGQPLGVRVTVRDAAARVESVWVLYTPSRGTTPFRQTLTSSGAGIWYGSIPGHMIGPGKQLLYYIQAENADGESAETEWHTVRVEESGVAPEAIPAASAVAEQARRQAQTPAPAPAPAPVPSTRSKYLIPGAVIVGGAVAVGGALAISHSSSSSGGGSHAAVTNANFGGNYAFCFSPTATETNVAQVCDSGLVNVYVRSGVVEVVGLWAAEIWSTPLNGHVFSVAKTVPARGDFPESYVILTGEIRGERCTVMVSGYSRDPDAPGNYQGQLDTTMR